MTATKMVVILVAALIGACTAASIPKQNLDVSTTAAPGCDPTTFVNCLDAYINGFNFPITIQTVEQLRAMMQAYFAQKGQTGFMNNCRAFQTFNACVKVIPELCFDPAFLQKVLGISLDEAYKATTYATQYRIECTLYQNQTVLDNWKCIDSAATKAMPIITQCILDLGTALESHPTPVQACAAGEKFATCVGAPLNAACGATVGNFWCHDMIDVLTGFGLGACPFKCFS